MCLYLQVCLRIRPMNEDEILYGASCIAHKVEDRVSIITQITQITQRTCNDELFGIDFVATVLSICESFTPYNQQQPIELSY